MADAYEHGFTRAQMRNRALVAPFHGIRVLATPSLTLELACRAIATRMPPGAALSHRTAALLHGMPLPLSSDAAIHVTVPSPGRALRRRGVRGHSAVLDAGDVTTLGGLPITTVERTWCDLAAMLNLPDLVAAADFLLWHEAPRTTAAQLASAVDRYPARAGRRMQRRALALTSDHSRSRPESLVRVDLALSGLPTPLANHEVFLPLARRTVYLDLAFPEQKLELEYHGDQHRTDIRQWRTDVRRANDIGDEGWQTLQFTGDDLADLPGLRRRVERRLRMLGWDG
ncbi:hypothetical protein [Mycetocola zhujimingii]|nr:hypothetical protein [Mycetocola zhujimingii]